MVFMGLFYEDFVGFFLAFWLFSRFLYVYRCTVFVLIVLCSYSWEKLGAFPRGNRSGFKNVLVVKN